MATKGLTSWSFSRYTDYKQCPLKAKLKHVDRLKEPSNQAMERGNAIHKLAEGFIKGTVKKLPPELEKFKAEFKALRAQYKKKNHGMVVEDSWAFTKTWGKTTWDNWVDCWVRIKLDCGHTIDGETLVITDWKTGKFRPEQNEDYVEQLELYALAALVRAEKDDRIKQVKPRLVYTDLGIIYPSKDHPYDDKQVELVFTRADIPKLKKLWDKRTRKMLLDKRFAPRPNDKCHWCHYRASNKDQGGGQCKF